MYNITNLKIHKDILLNDYLIKSLDLDDSYKYYKILNIAYNLPFKVYNTNNNYKNHNYYLNFIQSVLGQNSLSFLENIKTPIQTSFYDHILTLSNNLHLLDENDVKYGKMLLKFAKENESIMYLYKNDYETDQIEFRKFFESKIKGRIDKNLIGNVGEYLVYNCLRNNNLNPYHVSKELGNGFGYDLFHYEYYPKIIQCLDEIKATIRFKYNGNEDNFTLLFNEYDKMMATLEEENVLYQIFRVFISDNIYNEQSFFNTLFPKTDGSLENVIDNMIYHYSKVDYAYNKYNREIGYKYALEKVPLYTRGITF